MSCRADYLPFRLRAPVLVRRYLRLTQRHDLDTRFVGQYGYLNLPEGIAFCTSV